MESLEQTTGSVGGRDTLIAPHEVRELVARLSEATVESRGVDEVQTLEGLAVSTGIPVVRLRTELARMRGKRRMPWPWLAGMATCLALVGAAYLTRPRPKPVEAPPLVATAPNWHSAGLVPLSSVSYGPDSASVMVDPTFEPTHPLPKGLSLSATVGTVLWGTGDHRAAVIQRKLSEGEVGQISETARELLRYVREQAKARGLERGADGEYQVTLSLYSYYGICSTGMQLPGPGQSDGKARAAIERAVRTLMAQMQSQLDFQQRAREQAGPG